MDDDLNAGGEQTGDLGTQPRAIVADAPLRLQAEAAVNGNSTGTLASAPRRVLTEGATGDDAANAAAADAGGYVDFNGLGSDTNAGSGEYLEWTVPVDIAGFYDLAVGYALASSAGNRPMRLDVNGALWDRIFDMRNTGSNTIYAEATTRVFFDQGDNLVRLTANGFSGPNIDYLEVRLPDPNVFVFQAEDLAARASNDTPITVNRPITAEFLAQKNAATGGGNEAFRIGAEGGAFLDWGGATATADFSFTAPAAGVYTIAMTYANGSSAARPLKLIDAADGSEIGTFAIAATPLTLPRMPDDLGDIDPTPGGFSDDANAPSVPSGWETWATETITVTLPAGQSTLRLVIGGAGQSQGPNIDKIVVALFEADAPIAENTAPTAGRSRR